MSSSWIIGPAIFTAVAIFVLLPIISVVIGFAVWTFRRYRASRVLRCPERGKGAEVALDAAGAALTSAVGQPCLRVKDCSLWSEDRECTQACLRLAAR